MISISGRTWSIEPQVFNDQREYHKFLSGTVMQKVQENEQLSMWRLPSEIARCRLFAVEAIDALN